MIRQQRRHWVSNLLRHALPYRRAVAVLCAALVAQAIVVMLLPWPMAITVDYILADRPLPGWAQSIADALGAESMLGQLVLAGIALVLLAVLSGALRVIVRVRRRTLGLRMTADVSEETLEVVQRQSPVAASDIPPGDLVQRVVTDARCVETLVIGVALTAFGSLVTLVLLGGVVVSLSGSAALVGAAVPIGMAVVSRTFHPRMRRNAVGLAQTEATVTAATEQMLASLPEIQAFCAEDAELARFTREADARLAAAMRVERTTLGFRAGIGAMTALGTGAVLAFGGLGVLDGNGSVGDLLVVLAYVASLFGPVQELAHLAESVAAARAGAERLFDLEDAVEPVPEPEHPRPMPSTGSGASVRLENVSFGYAPDRPVLEGIELAIAPGETVGIVGPSGTGKSTLVGLIPRFYDPWWGTVKVGGVDVRSVATRDLRRRIAVVRQDPLLLPVSVRANIAYGRDDVTDDQVRRAAEHALAAEFIEQLPHGYDTVLAERGRTLSGGQRQRLAIARALCRDAAVLLLDEPTAGLDAESEAELLRLVASAASGRTVVLVTHRLSSLRGADRIVVLDGTRIVEQGRHAELADQGGVYSRYHALQSMRPGEPTGAEPHDRPISWRA